MSKISVRGKKLLIKFHGGPPSRIAGVAEIGPHNHRTNISELAHHEFYDSPRIELRAVVVQNTKIAPEQTCQIAIANRLGIQFPLTLPSCVSRSCGRKAAKLAFRQFVDSLRDQRIADQMLGREKLSRKVKGVRVGVFHSNSFYVDSSEHILCLCSSIQRWLPIIAEAYQCSTEP
jgi:hypothetical protein